MGAGGTLLTVIAPFVNIQFLGSSLTFMMVRGISLPGLRKPVQKHCKTAVGLHIRSVQSMHVGEAR